MSKGSFFTTLKRIEKNIIPFRQVITISVQGFLIILSNYLAFYLRFDGEIPADKYDLFIKTLPILLLLRFLFFYPFHLFHGLWRYISTKDILNIVASISLSSLFFSFVIKIWLGISAYPRSILVIDCIIAMMLLGGIRLVKRLCNECVSVAKEKKTLEKILVIGTKDGMEKILKEITNRRHYHYKIIGLVAYDYNRKGLTIHNIPILGALGELGKIIRETDPDEILMAIPSPPINLLRKILKVCRELEKPVKVIPDLKEILFGKTIQPLIRNIEPEDFLFRPPVDSNITSLKPFFVGKRVMITGVGGSIGSEISRQIANYSPSEFILFERHEGSLYDIEMELRGSHPKALLYPVIGDITDSQRVSEVIGRFQPQIIFHAAANKHVPMMEHNKSEAIKTNILGTKIVADAAVKNNVEMFVLISTDKAVNPINIMGASKKVAELVIQGMMDHSHKTKAVAVRFGNVLESSGSVIPLFKKQIKKGGPLTVTHPDMTRYFMTISEAVQLLLQAATMGKGGEVFVLDMGQPVKILDLAKTLICLYGLKPINNIDIVFTGLRPGERLNEKLFNLEEKVQKTAHPKVQMAVNGLVNSYKIDEHIESIKVAIQKGKHSEALNLVQKLAPTYNPEPDHSSATEIEIKEPDIAVSK